MEEWVRGVENTPWGKTRTQRNQHEPWQRTNNLEKPVIILSKDAEIDAPSKDYNEIYPLPDHRNHLVGIFKSCGS
jgi:hypothetical protein